MAEMKEMRFGENEINLKDTTVKSSVLPQGSKELSRDVKIQGNVVIEGGVFGNRIDVEAGKVTFEGAVYADAELYIKGDIAEPVTFKKTVATADTIAAFITSNRVLFYADINAQKVRLKNCYVGGSIFAQEIYIENCVVLGGVFAAKSSTITNCIVGTFNSRTVELAGVNYLLYPAGFSTEPVTYLPGSELYNISLAHLGALYKGEKENGNTGKIKMNLESDSLKTVLVGDDNVNTVVNSYSVSGRVLAADMIDMDKLENHFLIGAGALGTQILKTYSLNKEDGGKSKELTVENIADFFFDILSGKIIIQDLSGEVRFADIKRSLE